MKLELMDWKTAETAATEQLRASLVAVAVHEIVLREAKKQIKKLGGKTSEEEAEEAKKKIKKEVKNTSVG